MVYFSGSSFTISESLEEVQLKLMLNKPLNCCTVSVKVLIEELNGREIAKGKLYNLIMFCVEKYRQ